MNIIFFDTEVRVEFREDGRVDGSPFNPDNYLVSVHWQIGDEHGPVGAPRRAVMRHNEAPGPDRAAFEEFAQAYARADLVVAHNAKFDVLWLAETSVGFPRRVYCTMIGEYILARGQRVELSLAATAERRGAPAKLDITQEYFDKGIGYEAMPLELVVEYADADVAALVGIYYNQVRQYDEPVNRGLIPVRDLMNENLLVLVEMERNGIAIDEGALSAVEKEFQDEFDAANRRMSQIAAEVMGDTPVNFNSGVDMTALVYSRRVKDRDAFIAAFNIGTDARGKRKNPPRMTEAKFVGEVRRLTEVVHRTDAKHCAACSGHGFVRKVKKDGQPFARAFQCKACTGRGYVLEPNGRVAGLKLTPPDPSFASINGFSVDKDSIDILIDQAERKGYDLAVEFLTLLRRVNALSVYLNSFCGGIRRGLRPNGFLHTTFNQCTTRTGRLSSTDPNFQNQPRSGTFPIRRAVKSRFRGGSVMEADYSGLEFRVAGELSGDEQIFEDVETGKDVHKQTASIIHEKVTEAVTKAERQAAKADTFAPIYGGRGFDRPPHVRRYYDEFFNIYRGLGAKHDEWKTTAVAGRPIRIPSGREYAFPYAKRGRGGHVSQGTQIVNYPVQGFATADIVPLACIRASRILRREGAKSLLILTVHDSIVIDCFPGEERLCYDVLREAMLGVVDEMRERFGYSMRMPLAIEVEVGPNWLEKAAFEVCERAA